MVRPGQAVVVVLVVLAVALTVGVSIASRSVTELNVSTLEDESAKALDAAETGVEVALGNIASAGSIAVGGTDSTYEFSSATTGSGGSVSPPDLVKAGDTVTVFLSGHDAQGNIILGDAGAYNKPQMQLCWGNPNTDAYYSDVKQWPAIVVSLHYYRTATGTFGVATKAYDPNGARRANNGFANPGNSGTLPCTDRVYPFWARSVSLDSDLGLPAIGAVPMYMKIRLLYNGSTGHYVSVWEGGVGTQSFPNQGKNIVSLGKDGGTARKLSVFQRYYELPSIFDGALYSGAGLSKP